MYELSICTKDLECLISEIQGISVTNVREIRILIYCINVKKLKQFKTRCKDDMVNSDN